MDVLRAQLWKFETLDHVVCRDEGLVNIWLKRNDRLFLLDLELSLLFLDFPGYYLLILVLGRVLLLVAIVYLLD